MILNQIKFAIRNITKDFGYSLINILGLTIGISSTLFLLVYVFDELSYDKYHEHQEQIYRVVSHISETDDSFTWVVAQIPFAPQVKQDYPEVEDAIRFQGIGKSLFEYGERQFYDTDVNFVDSTVFDVFTYSMIEGNPKTSLNEPNSIVLTETFAKKLFGDEDPMGKMITNENRTLKVTGIIEDVPQNSHFRFSALMSWTTLESRRQSWGNFGLFTYVKLKEGTDLAAFDKKLEEMYDKFMAEIFKQYGVFIDYELQPISKIHLYPIGEGESEASGDIRFVKIFFLIAVFMLVIAGINYMNLTTARSTKRSREVGIRKVAGAHRSMLIRQFLTESVVLTVISLIISVGLCYILLPNFNNISGKSLDFSFFSNSSFLLSLISIIIILGLLSGTYPAFFLSRFKPINALKGKPTKGSGHGLLRKSLVIIQFVISLSMIISTMVVYEQLNYLKKKDMGFDKEKIVTVILNTRAMIEKLPVLRNEFLAVSGVESIGTTTTPMGEGSGKLLLSVETSEGMQEKGVNLAGCDYDFIQTLGIEMIEGRNFSKEFKTDTLSVLVNQTLADRFGWEEPLGKKVQFGDDQVSRVIGLMKDYHQTGLYNPVESFMLYLRDNCPVVYVKLESGSSQETIQNLEAAWIKTFPLMPFEYTYLEDNLFEQIAPDEKRGILFTLFSIIVIIIASLGVFGLASYTVEQRTKEISIRKVLGANAQTVIRLIFKEYLILIGISILIAFPVAYYYMQNFLDNYEYRTDLSVITFVIAAILLLLITLLTVVYHTVKIARSNPVDSLRKE
ncbi:MAG: ABC transporter permease [Bacteroidales bacterium]|nr:ABC transporter permease [Bacteroidales bacterium]